MTEPTPVQSNVAGPQNLSAKLREVGSRHRHVHLVASVAWSLLALVLTLAVVVWLDLLFDLAPVIRAAAPYMALAAALLMGAGLFTWHRRRFTSHRVARLVDETAGAQGVVLSGWDLLEGRSRGVWSNETSRGLAQLAIAGAAQTAMHVSAARAVPWKAAIRPWVIVAVVGLVVLIVLLAAPGWAQTEWSRFTYPWADVPPASSTQLVLEPGDVDVRYGDPLDIFVQVQGSPVEEVELVLRGESDSQEVVPMFREADGRWRAVLTRLTEPAEYHAMAFQSRSRRHRITILTVPEIADVRVEVIPPAYAQGIGQYRGPLPSAGISGLAGTVVRLVASSQRPLEGGEITWSASSGTSSVEMAPVPGETTQVQGEFTLVSAGKFELRVRDVEGQVSRDAVAGTISLKPDHRPFVRLLQPRAVSLATPEAALPVEIAGEDDFGLSRIQLFRSLNDSRPLPLDLPVGQPAPRRQIDTVSLPLSGYGLQPGDQIKLFARVEDNDPAGAKGAETPVATVHVISQEEFERMLRAREGLNVLMSKYRQAQRMLESLQQQAKQLREKTEGKKGLVSKKDRQQAQKLAEQLRQQAEALTKAAKHQLPYDADAQLSEHLEKLAQQLEQAAQHLERRLERLEGEPQQQQALDAELAELLGLLGQQSDLYNESALMPLQQLEQVMPLLVAQARFEQLVQAQRDLAKRLAGLKGRDGEDDPALKARMRDLQEEQERLREELDSLTADIEDAAAQLPETQELAPLRKTAEQFVSALRESGAAAEMNEAEQGLSEFSGTRGHKHAEQAADALEQLLSQSEAMQGQGVGRLTFSPGLGQTAAQLLAEMGLGQGGGSGFSARRGGNVGLYGGLPSLAGMAGGEPGQPGNQGGAQGNSSQGIGGENPDQDSLADLLTPSGLSGSGATLVPLRYRDRVGQYFRRLSTELQQADAYPEEPR